MPITSKPCSHRNALDSAPISPPAPLTTAVATAHKPSWRPCGRIHVRRLTSRHDRSRSRRHGPGVRRWRPRVPNGVRPGGNGPRAGSGGPLRPDAVPVPPGRFGQPARDRGSARTTAAGRPQRLGGDHCGLVRAGRGAQRPAVLVLDRDRARRRVGGPAARSPGVAAARAARERAGAAADGAPRPARGGAGVRDLAVEPGERRPRGWAPARTGSASSRSRSISRRSHRRRRRTGSGRWRRPCWRSSGGRTTRARTPACSSTRSGGCRTCAPC